MIKLTLGKPVIVSQASSEIRSWGPWQFPSIERMADGRLHIWYHIQEDSAKAYGMSKGHALSDDEGETWTVCKTFSDTGGLLLNNGDRIRDKELRPIDIAEAGLQPPAPIGGSSNYSVKCILYNAADFSDRLKGWHLLRLARDGATWEEEQAKVNIPGETRYKIYDIIPYPHFWRMRLDRQGNIWGIIYTYRVGSGVQLDKAEAVFIRSKDNGFNWDFVGAIPYHPDVQRDIKWNKRGGFSEPDISFMPDGSIFCLLRTTDGEGPGPCYWSRSTDGGYTWSVPKVYDDIGVWPTLLTLKSGITISVYGRPGLYVRATADPSGQMWEPRITVVQPGVNEWGDTCAYADLIELNDRTVLLTYSDFNVPYLNGHKCKTILARKIYIE